MKIIDDEGRLFGKINLIDFLFCLFIIFLTPMFFYGYKLFFTNSGFDQSEPGPYVEKIYKAYFYDVSPEVARKIKIGDEAFNDQGKVIGVLLWVDDADLEEITKNKRKKIDYHIPVTLKLKVRVREVYVYYNNILLELNRDFIFDTKKYSIKTKLLFEAR